MNASQKRRRRLHIGYRQHMQTLVSKLQKDCASWMEKAEELQAAQRVLLEQLDLRRLHQAHDVWFWQGEGDKLESMSNSMAVVIRADQLRALLTAGDLLVTRNEPDLWISETNLLALKNKGMAYATGFDTGGQIPFYRST